MKKIAPILIGLFLATSTLYGQVRGSVIYINNLADKKTATVEDGVIMVMTTLNIPSFGFNFDVNNLKKRNLLKDRDFDRNDPLTRGLLSYMIARQLELNDSLFFLIFKSERYAYRACIAHRIMDPDGSEHDRLSGEEVIEIMAEVEKILEARR